MVIELEVEAQNVADVRFDLVGSVHQACSSANSDVPHLRLGCKDRRGGGKEKRSENRCEEHYEWEEEKKDVEIEEEMKVEGRRKKVL